MTRLLKIGTVLAVTALLCGSTVQVRAQQGFRVIVNKDNPVTALSKEEVSRMLLKRTTRWDSGVPVEPVDQNSESAVRGAFSDDIHGRSVNKIKIYWQRQIFSGSEVPPRELTSDAEVVSYVSSNSGAIGYVSSGASLNGVKALRIEG